MRIFLRHSSFGIRWQWRCKSYTFAYVHKVARNPIGSRYNSGSYSDGDGKRNLRSIRECTKSSVAPSFIQTSKIGKQSFKIQILLYVPACSTFKFWIFFSNEQANSSRFILTINTDHFYIFCYNTLRKKHSNSTWQATNKTCCHAAQGTRCTVPYTLSTTA